MKILVIGDFHGKFPKKLQSLANEVDLVLSVGDYAPFSFRNELEKNILSGDIDSVDEKKIELADKKDWDKAEDVIKILNESRVPVVTTVGNYDRHMINDCSGGDYIYQKFLKKFDEFSRLIKKYPKIIRSDYRGIKAGDLIIIGAYGGTYPGEEGSFNFKSYYKILENLFEKYKKENKAGRVIFMSHNMPHNCKLDIIRDKKAAPSLVGEHLGSILIRKIIDKYQPVLAVGGHFHENFGKTKLGKTLVLDAGEAGKSRGIIVNMDTKKGRIKSLKFVK